MGHAHKAKAPVVACEAVHDEAALGHLAAGLEQGPEGRLVHAVGDVPHVQVALVCRLRGCCPSRLLALLVWRPAAALLSQPCVSNQVQLARQLRPGHTTSHKLRCSSRHAVVTKDVPVGMVTFFQAAGLLGGLGLCACSCTLHQVRQTWSRPART